MKSIQVEREIFRYEQGEFKHIEDSIVTEFPVTVKINGQEFVTMVSTPEYIEDMVIGFLASEGIIRKYEDIDEIWMRGKEGYVHVTTTKINPYYRDIQNKRYITSCCGMSRQGFVFANDALTAKKMNDIRVKISAQDCFRLMNDMQQSASTFQQTGGVHNAALCDVNGIVLSRMDIGRHNALDKIYGYCLKNNISIGDKIIVFSGRISSEILLKVAKIGCEVILSKSAPTELALELAEQLGITTIGFIRNQSLNVYTHPKRVVNIK
ncbi:formate dehydrogenase family accessory protein FdhD [Bacillus pseudomycoides]|uniref:Sulfur carrier protein FdhD n=1 Tax=Bacillus pseudomycoides TaxID=64104 RepID=A0AA91V8Q0_9BACI|nr:MULTISPECIES: formate dehydrogenase accessory sulfurtransferase FdhD [Bacillus]PEB56089.1 formate dehydrogenase family accessory protein FdhD [Bacillus sp. AFS098217]PED80299.1 formate dehydrogenase family accessory protein FdhD [Bacillus pseudomycoides]PEU10163.1 formate dehydrogenase family accessory protein FdhD [Bacillus sp. AFS014408]PEU18022.1 formate dehydrogenase family accessory protein FdhD [Bacillus sp. AFS019443]PFW61211.1 formate dehydrogenase family accessory protein FdhD [Bac